MANVDTTPALMNGDVPVVLPRVDVVDLRDTKGIDGTMLQIRHTLALVRALSSEG